MEHYPHLMPQLPMHFARCILVGVNMQSEIYRIVAIENPGNGSRRWCLSILVLSFSRVVVLLFFFLLFFFLGFFFGFFLIFLIFLLFLLLLFLLLLFLSLSRLLRSVQLCSDLLHILNSLFCFLFQFSEISTSEFVQWDRDALRSFSVVDYSHKCQ